MPVRRRKVSLDNVTAPLLPLPPPSLNPGVSVKGLARLARKKKPDGWGIVSLEVAGVLVILLVFYCSYYYMEHIHFHAANFYAHLGHPNAQHLVAHKYMAGSGVEKNHTIAFQWFRKAADQGHPHSAYNLAVGHMQGFRTDVKKGEAKTLIKLAAKGGVELAKDVLKNVCPKGHCNH